MSTLIKQGVYGDLNREISNARRTIECMATASGEDLVITSIREGTHTAGTLHHQGDAFDMRPLKHVVIGELVKHLSKDIDVVNENDHWHIEYDPKS
jgi:hypothetical protein